MPSLSEMIFWKLDFEGNDMDIRSLTLLLFLILLVACGEQKSIDAPSKMTPPLKAVVGPVEREFREKVIATMARFDEKSATRLRIMYAVLDQGESSNAVREVGGIDFVQSEIAAGEIYYYLRPLEECVIAKFDSLTDEGNARLIERIAASDQYALLIADAQRNAPDDYKRHITESGANPSRSQHVVSALLTLMEHRRKVSEYNSAKSLAIVARTSLYSAAVSDGECVPRPELLLRMEKYL